MSVDDVLAMAMEKGCFSLHRAEWQESLLSSDGRRLFCRFRGPDAESVRMALRGAKASGRFWPGTIHDAPGVTTADLGAANVLVERELDSTVSCEKIRARAAAGGVESGGVTWLRSFCSNDRRRMVCLYRAPDAEAVRRAQRRANLPLADAWPFTVVRRG
jgi:hypothetical protein